MPIRLSGMVSGMDTETLVSALVSGYKLKKDNLVKAQTKLSWKQEKWKTMNTSIYSFYSGKLSAGRLSNAYSLKKSTVSNSTVATVTASSSAVAGTQKLKVKKLASSGYLTGGTVKDGKANITGSSKLSDITGSTSQGSVTLSVDGKSTNIELTEDMTVNQFVVKLKDAGVQASFDENNQRFFISSKTSGKDGDFALVANDSAGMDSLRNLRLYTNDKTSQAEYAKWAKYYNADTAGYYCYDEQTTNHAVTVVGWDDDYPAQNFPTAPEGNGAWIVRNSWGSDFGEDGYFYISYYDQSLSGSAVAFEAEPADNYDNNYQYDGSAFAMMTGKQQFKAANVFTAKANENGTEQIAAASFEVMAKQMDYTVSIYTGLTDVDNPESGELKAQKSGSFSSGDKDNLLKTVAFDEPVTVNQGEIFSVVAAFAGSGGQSVMLYYDCARTLNGIQANCAAQPHQSYIYLNEYYGWSDYGNTNNTNFRIKAFTNNVAEPDTAVTAVKLNKHALELNWQQSEQLTAEVLPENAANKNVIWTSSDSGVAEVSQEGVVTAKGAGSAVITVEIEDGKMQDSCTVTVKKPITDIKITGTGELKAGDKAALSVVILPQDTTDDTTVVWTSSDTNIAAVDQNGLVTALSKGTVTITAKAGTHTAEHTLVITQAAPKPTESTTEATTEVTKPTQKPTESTTEATTEAPKPTQKPTESTTEATTEAPKPTPKPTESTTEATTEAPKPTQKPTEATTEATKPTESTTEVTKPSEQPTETPTQKPDTEPTQRKKLSMKCVRMQRVYGTIMQMM